MNYANFQRTISLYKVLKISSIKALKTDSFFEQIFIPILNTLPERAKALFADVIALLPFQGVPASTAYKPRVPLCSALGYALVALSGRSFQTYIWGNCIFV